MNLPDEWLEAYLAADGLAATLSMMSSGASGFVDNPEAALERSLAVALLFQRFSMPRALEERILNRADALAGPLLVRASGTTTGVRIWPAGTRAELLSAIRAAWSRGYPPGLERVPDWPAVAMLERSAVTPEELASASLWTERMPDGGYLGMDPDRLSSALESAAGRVGIEALIQTCAYARYALGCSYNATTLPADPFEFLGMLASGDKGRDLRERYLSLGRTRGDATAQAYLDLAVRSLALEAAAVEREPAVPDRSPVSGRASSVRRDERTRAQQLTGSASSPGRASGVLRGASGFAGDAGAGGAGAVAQVLVCERFHRGLLALRPVAVIERRGGRLGSGAALARDHKLPCVSGVGDVDMLPEGAAVRVDGWLGLVTLAG